MKKLAIFAFIIALSLSSVPAFAADATFTPSPVYDSVSTTVNCPTPSGNYRIKNTVTDEWVVSFVSCSTPFSLVAGSYYIQPDGAGFDATFFTITTPPATGWDMDTATALVTSTLGDFGDSALIVVTAFIGLAVAYLLFRFAWRKIRGSVR